MILDSLADALRYHPLHPGIAIGLEYLTAFDPDTDDGRYPVDGEQVFAIVESYHTAPGAEKRFESHRLHLDIQHVVSGRERILHAPAGALDVETSYDAASDIVFYQEPGASSSLLLRAGDFAILYPDDAHKPGCMAGARDRVRKVVVKVRI